MTIAPAVKFPVIGLSSPTRGGAYAFVANSYEEMRETPLHSYMCGFLNDQYFIDATCRRLEATNLRFAGFDLTRMRQIGLGAALLSGLLTGLNLPVLVNFELVEGDFVEFEALRATLLRCVETRPQYYTLRLSQQKVANKLLRACDVAELAAALS